jgi:riboflavin transporter FmnP
VPIFIGAFAFGVTPGLAIAAVVCVVQGVTVSAASGPIGIIMHFVATGSFVLVAGLIYRKNKTKKTAVIALLCGVVTMTIMMALWNILVTPLYMGVPRDAVIAMLLPVFIPFNLIRGLINATITFLLYKRIAKYLHG